MRPYIEVLRVPSVRALVVATTVSRLPVGLNPLALVLFLVAETGSYATAGAVTGGLALGTALGQPLLSRAVDARGGALMVPVSAGHAVGLLAVLMLGTAGGPTAALVAAAVLAGAALPPTSSVLRALWPVLLGGRTHLAAPAYALDAVLVQFTFVLGPLVVAALVAVASPAFALACSAATAVAGTLAFVLAAPPAGAARGRPRAGLLGPLATPGIVTLAVSQVPVGIAFGSLQVALPAFAQAEGEPGAAGVLLALVSLASVVGALVLGARPRALALDRLHVRLAALVPLGFVPALLAPSVAAMALLVLPAGALLSAYFATRNELARAASPRGMEVEAVTWPLTALIAGTAIGAALAGVLSEAEGARAALAAAAVAAAAGSALVLVRKGTLTPARVP